MLRSSLCDYSDAHILVKWNITVNNNAAAAGGGAAQLIVTKKQYSKIVRHYKQNKSAK